VTDRHVTAVILAGGRSSRFGRDKLAEPLGGRPLLEHAIEAVRPHATEILVVTAPGAIPALPEGVTVVHDPVPFEGPLVGLLAGLRVAAGPVVLVIGGDMPALVGAVIESMLAELDAPETPDAPEAPGAPAGIDAVVLEHNGRAHPLPIVVRLEPALAAAGRLVGDGERRLRALADDLAARVVPEPNWRSMDPDGLTLRDIDTPADLP
jgi:Molybdopterin-guanine dinucleotide biosynthesis protein A